MPINETVVKKIGKSNLQKAIKEFNNAKFYNADFKAITIKASPIPKDAEWDSEEMTENINSFINGVDQARFVMDDEGGFIDLIGDDAGDDKFSEYAPVLVLRVYGDLLPEEEDDEKLDETEESNMTIQDSSIFELAEEDRIEDEKLEVVDADFLGSEEKEIDKVFNEMETLSEDEEIFDDLDESYNPDVDFSPDLIENPAFESPARYDFQRVETKPCLKITEMAANITQHAMTEWYDKEWETKTIVEYMTKIFNELMALNKKEI